MSEISQMLAQGERDDWQEPITSRLDTIIELLQRTTDGKGAPADANPPREMSREELVEAIRQRSVLVGRSARVLIDGSRGYVCEARIYGDDADYAVVEFDDGSCRPFRVPRGHHRGAGGGGT